MPIELGGVTWSLAVKYTGKDASAQAKKDLKELAKESLETRVAIIELEKAEKDLTKAHNDAVEASNKVKQAKVDSAKLARDHAQAIENERKAVEAFNAAQDEQLRLSRAIAASPAGAGRRALIEQSMFHQDTVLGPSYQASIAAAAATRMAREAANQGWLGVQQAAIADVGAVSQLEVAANKATIAEEKLNVAANAAAQSTNFQSKVTETAAQKKARLADDARDAADAETALGNAAMTASDYIQLLAGALAALNLYQFIRDTTLLAGRVENLGTILNHVGTTAGFTRGGIEGLEHSVISLGITTRQAREGLALLAQSEIDLRQATQLARIAQDAAVIAGKNSSDAYEQMVYAIQRTNTWMLRQLGILVNLNNVYRDYAIQSGRVVTTLSTQEKQQLLINEIIKKGAVIAGTYEASLGDVYKRYTSMDRVIEESKRLFGEQFLPTFQLVVDTSTELLIEWQKMPDSLHAAAAAAATFSTSLAVLGVTARIAQLALAGMGPALAFLATPTGLVVSGISALAAAYVYFTAESRNATEAMNKQTLEMQKQVNESAILRDSYLQLADADARVRDGQELSLDRQAKVNQAMAAAILLLPEYREELMRFQSTGEYWRFASIVAGADSNVLKTTENRLEELKANLQVVKQEIASNKAELLSEKNQDWGPTAATNRLALANKILELAEQRKSLLIEIQALEESANQQQFQKFNERLKEHETALNLAHRAESKYQTERKKLWHEANGEILEEFIGNLNQISNKFLSPDEIKKAWDVNFRAIKMADIDSNLADQLQKAGANQDEVKKAHANYNKAVLTLNMEIREHIETEIRESKEIAENLAHVPETLALLLERINSETDAAQERLRSDILGLDPDVGKEKEKLENLLKQREEFQQHTLELIQKHQEEAEKLLADGKEKEAQMEFTKLQGILDFRRAQNAKLQAEEAQSRFDVLRKVQDANDKLIAEEKRLVEERAKLTGESVDNSIKGVEKLIEEQKRATKSVDDFIQDIHRKNMDREVPGYSNLAKTFDDFKEKIGQATSPEQLNALSNLVGGALRSETDKSAEKLDELTQKMQELRHQQALLKQQSQKEYAEALLKGIPQGVAFREVGMKHAKQEHNLNLQINKLQEEINEKQGAGGNLVIKRMDFEIKLKKMIDARREELAGEEDLEKKLQGLKDKELLMLDDEITKNQQLLAIYKEQLAAMQDQADAVKDRRRQMGFPDIEGPKAAENREKREGFIKGIEGNMEAFARRRGVDALQRWAARMDVAKANNFENIDDPGILLNDPNLFDRKKEQEKLKENRRKAALAREKAKKRAGLLQQARDAFGDPNMFREGNEDLGMDDLLRLQKENWKKLQDGNGGIWFDKDWEDGEGNMGVWRNEFDHIGEGKEREKHLQDTKERMLLERQRQREFNQKRMRGDLIPGWNDVGVNNAGERLRELNGLQQGVGGALTAQGEATIAALQQLAAGMTDIIQNANDHTRQISQVHENVKNGRVGLRDAFRVRGLG